MLTAELSGHAQVFETRTGVDTLMWGERISLHTNTVDWALMVPNIGVEVDVKNVNWNRWAVGLDLKWRWQTAATFKQPHFYAVSGARLYYRNYWRTRQVKDRLHPQSDYTTHHSPFDRLFSCRRRKVRHPHTTYYRGAYLSYTDISYKIYGGYGHQGQVVSGGVSYGIVRPLYTFMSDNSLDLDIGFDAGIVATHMERFTMGSDDCYVLNRPAQWNIKPYPLPTAVRVALVYRFGHYPITKKYRWRYDVDVDYQNSIRDRMLRLDSIRREKTYADSMYHIIVRDFMMHYDSIAAAHRRQALLQPSLQKQAAGQNGGVPMHKTVPAGKGEKKNKKRKRENAQITVEHPAPADSLSAPADSLSAPTGSLSVTALEANDSEKQAVDAQDTDAGDDSGQQPGNTGTDVSQARSAEEHVEKEEPDTDNENNEK